MITQAFRDDFLEIIDIGHVRLRRSRWGWTALTRLTVLTALTADLVDVIDVVDGVGFGNDSHSPQAISFNPPVNEVKLVNSVRGQHRQSCQSSQHRQNHAAARRRSKKPLH